MTTPTLTSSASDIATLIGSYLGLNASLSLAILTLLFGLWTNLRSQSSHLFMVRVWRLVYGRQSIKDRELLKFVQTRDRLIFLRMHGVPARTLAQGKKLLAWADDHDEEIADVNACGPYFDREKCELRVKALPSIWIVLLAALATAALALTLAFTGTLAASPRALLQFKESGTWFFIDTRHATSFRKSQTVSVQSCASTEPRLPSADDVFNAKEASDICTIMKSDSLAAYVETAVRGQRWGFGLISAMLAFWAAQLLIFLRRFSLANAMRHRLDDRKAGKQSGDAPSTSPKGE